MSVPVVQFVIKGEPVTGAFEGRPYTVVYDGACKVCGRLSRVLEKWDRHTQLEIIPSQTAGVNARFPWIPARAYQESLQLIGPGGRTWQGAAAIEQLLNILPRGRLISWIFRIPLVRGIADRFYRWFARNRYKLGCGDHCQLRPQDVDFEARDASRFPAPH
jgi:predicted DCC family thiol-disulfide oxidoreductase YuxK